MLAARIAAQYALPAPIGSALDQTLREVGESAVRFARKDIINLRIRFEEGLAHSAFAVRSTETDHDVRIQLAQTPRDSKGRTVLLERTGKTYNQRAGLREALRLNLHEAARRGPNALQLFQMGG